MAPSEWITFGFTTTKSYEQMTHEEKTELFLKGYSNARRSSRMKTESELLPIDMKYGSSTHHPDRRGGVTTCDIVLYVKFLDGDWFRPYGGFDIMQIKGMIDICKNDSQIVSLMELLSAKR